MSRRRNRWLSSKNTNRCRSATRERSVVPLYRRLRFEPLEERWLLANVTVGNTNDVVNGNVTSIAALIATPGADGISLREAIQAANADAAADAIDFGPTITGTIPLTNAGHDGEIAISSHLTINGPGASLLTIRAFDPSATLGDGARIFNVNDFLSFTTKTVAISGLTLTGGDVASSTGGGAILNSENLTITACTISGNNAGTSTQTFRGGGIANVGGNLSVIASTISGNSSRGRGAGIYSNLGSLTIANSTISGNAANLSSGGGVYSASSTTTIDSSTISGNSATSGGGIANDGATMTITNSTISGNSAIVSGGGVGAFSGTVNVRHSSITLNRADSDNNASGTGGGIFVSFNATIDHTIVAGNLRSATTRDDISGAVTARYSLIGDSTGATITNNGGNQIGTGASPINALLGPLANNGGPTETHTLSLLSMAIDAGDPVFAPPPDFDQRGNVFPRVLDGDGDSVARIDIGAYEQVTLVSNLVVDTLADENDGNYSAGDLSLREAIDVANLASAGADTISFAASLTSGGPASINLTNVGHLAITESVTIIGPGAKLLTIRAFDFGVGSGNGAQVFRIDDGNAGTLQNVSISGLTLTGADPLVEGANGGAIQSVENLTLAQCTLTGNVVASGGDGGAVYQGAGSLSITDCTIAGNTAANGGGVFVKTATATIINTTISGNSAEGYGGGVHLSSGSLTVRHSTITFNKADSDNNSSGTGGGVFVASGQATLDHTIVAGNLRSDSTRDDISGAVTARYSFIGDNTGATITDNGGNQIGTSGSPINPLLGPLGDNGGPTFTHAFISIPNSPAIDAGDPAAVAGMGSVPLFDQRGNPFSRVGDGDGDSVARIDIGAYERRFVNLIVDTLADENDGDHSAGDLSLREAIGLAVGSFGTITFAPALTSGRPATILLSMGELVITSSLTINGPGANLLTIDASGNDPTPDSTYNDENVDNDRDGSRIFNIDIAGPVTADVKLVGLALTGADVNGHGGAILLGSPERLTVTECTIDGNLAGASGGGIAGLGTGLEITASTISGNTAAGRGGGIYNENGTLIVNSSTISDNTALDRGGGIANSNANLFITDSTITGNSGAFGGDGGGGVWNRTETSSYFFRVTDSTISGNSTLLESGGGIFNYGPGLQITGSTISGNTADFRGGGVFTDAGTVSVSSTTISDNSTTFGPGGGIYSRGSLFVTGSTISGNSAVGEFSDGGGILSGRLFMSDSTISGNSAGHNGGGIWTNNFSGDQANIISSTISGNIAAANGGGLYDFGGLIVIRHSTITMNQAAADGGGGVARRSGNNLDFINVESSIIAGNTSGGDVQFVGGGTNPFVSRTYNLVGTGNAVAAFNQLDQTGVTNPMLGPLADNGGPTMTQALLSGSPALDAGDLFAVAGHNVPLYDQRGAPFTRVLDGNGVDGLRIDIGAFESPTVPPQLPGDYNLNRIVEAADYVLWRKTLGASVAPPFVGADGDGDGTVGQSDHGVWTAHFGQTLPPGAGSGAREESRVGGVARPGSATGVVDGNAIATPFAEPQGVPPSSQVGQAVPDSLGADIVVSRQAQPDLQAASERDIALAALDPVSQRKDRSPIRGPLNRYRLAAFEGGDLLLVAIDRAWRSPGQNVPATTDRESNDQHTDDGLPSLADDPLDLATEQQKVPGTFSLAAEQQKVPGTFSLAARQSLNSPGG